MKNTIELRAIAIDLPNGELRRIIFTRNILTGEYNDIIFPTDKPFNRGQILKLISDFYHVPPGDIYWPPYINIP